MFTLSRFICGLVAVMLAMSVFATAQADPAPLTIAEAVKLALQRDDVLQQLASEKDAAIQEAVAAGQLPDPKLSIGIQNLPTNSFSVGRDSMTMQIIGISQEFPAGHTRALAESRGQQLAEAQQAKIAERSRQVAQDVRIAWLQLYYALHAAQLVQASEVAFQQFTDIAKVRYENGSGTQQEWLRARLELAMLKARKLDLQAQAQTSRAALERWVGEDAGVRPLPDQLPVLPDPPSYDAILNALPSHPLAAADDAQIAVAQTAVDIAKQAYQPKWGVDLSYGRRPGGDASGPFANMVSAMVSVSLPIFTGQRQDRTVAAAQAQVSANTYSRDDQLRRLKQTLDEDWAHWQQLQQLESLHTQTIMPDANADVTAGLDAYRNGAGDFFELIRAQVGDLDVQIQFIKIETELDSVKAQLMYLAGEQP